MLSTCLGCGCTCDDIEVQVEDARIVEARHACPRGVAWFGDGVVPSVVRVAGRDADADRAFDAAARILLEARRPLVYLGADLSCEAQREAIALADGQRAVLGSLTASTAIGSILAAQERGRPGATLGEIRNRADLLVFWGVDPAVRYPRYWTRYAPEPQGVHVPDGRKSRRVIAVDLGEQRGPADADDRFQIAPERELDVLGTMTALAATAHAGEAADAAGGTPAALVRAMQTARYVAIVVDAEPRDDEGAGSGARPGALIGLAQALNGVTRCALSVLRGGGNRSGADACLTSQTGYPAAVDFSPGYPRYRPHEFSAYVASSDAALVLGSAEAIPRPVLDAVLPAVRVVIGPRASTGPFGGAEVVIDTAIAGIHEGGTAVRMDEIPLPLRPPLAGPLPAAVAIRQLHDRVSLRTV